MHTTKGILRENRKTIESQQLLDSKRAFVGIDLGKERHVAVIADRNGNVLGAAVPAHSVAGVDKLLDQVRKAFPSGFSVETVIATTNG